MTPTRETTGRGRRLPTELVHDSSRRRILHRLVAVVLDAVATAARITSGFPLSTTTGTPVGPAVVQLETLGLTDDAGLGPHGYADLELGGGRVCHRSNRPLVSVAHALDRRRGSQRPASTTSTPTGRGHRLLSPRCDDGSDDLPAGEHRRAGSTASPAEPATAATTTQPAVTPSPVTTTTTPAASRPRHPARTGRPRGRSRRFRHVSRRLHGHLVVSVRVRAGARATAHARVLRTVRRGSTTIALATRTTDLRTALPPGGARGCSEPGRYTATAAVRR